MTQTPAQLRKVGRIILACGVLAGIVVYWLEVRALSPDDTGFVHTRSSDNQMSRLMGHFGLVMADWSSWLSTPAAHGLGVFVLVALVAGYFLRVASVMEDEQRPD